MASSFCGERTDCFSSFGGLLGPINLSELLKFEEERYTYQLICSGRRRKTHKGDEVQGDLGAPENLSNAIFTPAVGGLGQTAAIPVLDTLKYFRNDCASRISQSVFLKSFQPIEVSQESEAQQNSFPMNRLKEVEK